MHDRILFIKIDWLDRYRGEDPPLPPVPGDFCGERFNFKPFQGRVFGAAPRLKGFGLSNADLHPWLVIWVARPSAVNPGEDKGTYSPVGWYERATLSRSNQDRPEYANDPGFPHFLNGAPFRYMIHTGEKDAYLIPAERRQFFSEISTKPIPAGPIRFGSTMILVLRGALENSENGGKATPPSQRKLSVGAIPPIAAIS